MRTGGARRELQNSAERRDGPRRGTAPAAEPTGELARALADIAAGLGAAKFIPQGRSLKQLAAASQACEGCDLYQNATQAVFGKGPRRAEILFVGEQPGDQEDVQGRPFVGPAGAILRKALAEVGIDAARTYVTNAVKHFKWTPGPKGKKRLHSKPSAAQLRACRPWVVREIELIKPRVIVLLGATAGQALLGRSFRVGAMRGRVLLDTGWAEAVVATIHPSAVLRAPDEAGRREMYASLVRDLKIAISAIAERE